ncbi:hypothetical protein SCA6_001977, partial [Theobroma cacao]
MKKKKQSASSVDLFWTMTVSMGQTISNIIVIIVLGETCDIGQIIFVKEHDPILM